MALKINHIQSGGSENNCHLYIVPVVNGALWKIVLFVEYILDGHVLKYARCTLI